MPDSASHLQQTSRLYAAAQLVHLSERGDYEDWRRAWRAREREDNRWRSFAEDRLRELRAALPDEQALAEHALQMRKETRPSDNFDPAEYARWLRSRISGRDLERGALTIYLREALQTGAHAGQFTLDALGLNKTFAWAQPRNMAQAVYATRGSKVVQHMYGSHLDKLTSIVEQATRPTEPRAIGDVVKEIRTNWDNLTKYQAERIARTETAAVWETTNLNAMTANGVATVDSLIATGPSIGVQYEAPCPICVDFATGGPYKLEELIDWPPLHPNCRCTLVPAEDFLPPAEPWAGGGDGSDLTGTEVFE